MKKLICLMFVILNFLCFSNILLAKDRQVRRVVDSASREMFDDFDKMGHRPSRRINKINDIFSDDVYINWDEQDFSPRLDVRQDKDHLVVICDLPGMDKDKIEITVKDNNLIISGKRESDETIEEKGEDSYLYRSIKNYGSFSRAIPLPQGVDKKNIDAKYKNGVLTVKIKYEQPENEAEGYKVKIE